MIIVLNTTAKTIDLQGKLPDNKTNRDIVEQAIAEIDDSYKITTHPVREKYNLTTNELYGRTLQSNVT